MSGAKNANGPLLEEGVSTRGYCEHCTRCTVVKSTLSAILNLFRRYIYNLRVDTKFCYVALSGEFFLSLLFAFAGE